MIVSFFSTNATMTNPFVTFIQVKLTCFSVPSRCRILRIVAGAQNALICIQTLFFPNMGITVNKMFSVFVLVVWAALLSFWNQVSFCATVLASVLQVTCSFHELQPQENKYDVISIYDKFVTLFCFAYSPTKHV